MNAYRFTRHVETVLSRADATLALARQIQQSLAEISPCPSLWRKN